MSYWFSQGRLIAESASKPGSSDCLWWLSCCTFSSIAGQPPNCLCNVSCPWADKEHWPAGHQKPAKSTNAQQGKRIGKTYYPIAILVLTDIASNSLQTRASFTPFFICKGKSGRQPDRRARLLCPPWLANLNFDHGATTSYYCLWIQSYRGQQSQVVDTATIKLVQ